jgi:8-amino-7-oxononanoate synthase
VICGDEWAAFRLARYCQDRGFYVQAIPPPVVPKGTARLRVSITAGHTREHLDRFAAVLDQGLAALGIPRDGSGVRCGETECAPPVGDGEPAMEAVAVV